MHLKSGLKIKYAKTTDSGAVAYIICDWLWENPPVMHKDNYLEKRN